MIDREATPFGVGNSVFVAQILGPDPDSHLGVAKALKVDPDSGVC